MKPRPIVSYIEGTPQYFRLAGGRPGRRRVGADVELTLQLDLGVWQDIRRAAADAMGTTCGEVPAEAIDEWVREVVDRAIARHWTTRRESREAI